MNSNLFLMTKKDIRLSRRVRKLGHGDAIIKLLNKVENKEEST